MYCTHIIPGDSAIQSKEESKKLEDTFCLISQPCVQGDRVTLAPRSDQVQDKENSLKRRSISVCLNCHLALLIGLPYPLEIGSNF